MAITVANLVAQVGADLTQFRIGMNEVEARLKHVEVRGRHSQEVVDRMRKSADMYRQSAASNMAKAASIDFAGIRSKIATASTDAKNAMDKVTNAQSKVTTAMSQGVQKNIQSATKELEKAIKGAEKYANILERANKQLASAQSRRQSLIGTANRQLFTASGLDSRAAAYDEEGRAAREVAKAYAARLAQNAFEHRIRAFNAVGAQATTGGVMGAAVIGAGVKVGSDIEETMSRAYHNTTLTSQGLDVMRQTIRKLAGDSGADLNELIEGFRRIQNYGLSASDSAKVLDVAMRSAVASGSDLSTTGELLASTMKTFKIPIEQATATMDQLHVAANLSSLELKQLVDSAAPAYAAASRMGVSFTETNSAMVLFTRYLQGDAPRAVTQWVNVLNKIGNPTKQVKTALANLREESKKAGVNLERDFTQAGLRARGFANIVEDIQKVANVKGVVPEDLMSKLIPNLRGTAGASIAVQHLKEYKEIYKELVDATGKDSVTNKQYAESLKLTNVEMRRLKNEVLLLAADLAGALGPSVRNITENFRSMLQSLAGMDPSTKRTISNAMALSATFLILFGITSKLIVGMASLRTALITFGILAQGQSIRSLLAGFLTKIPPAAALAVTALAAVAFAVYRIKNAIDDASKPFNVPSVTSTMKGEVTAAGKQTDQARQAYDTAVSVNKLVAEYTKLKQVLNPTKEQMQKLHELLGGIRDLAPNLISGYDKTGQAIGLIGDAAGKSAALVAHLNEELTRTAVAETNMRRGLVLAEKAAISKQIYNVQSSLKYGYAEGIFTRGPKDPSGFVKMGSHKFGPEDTARYNKQLQELTTKRTQLNDEFFRLQAQVNSLRGGNLSSVYSKVQNPFTKGYGAAPPDKLAGIYDSNKEKKGKKSEAEQLRERALAFLESLKQQRYMIENEGKLAEATWELNHAYKSLADDGLKKSISKEAEALDIALQSKEAWKEWRDLVMEKKRLQLEQADATHVEMVALEMQADKYRKMTPEQKKMIELQRIEIAQMKDKARVAETIARVVEKINEPLDKEMSPFAQMFKELSGDKKTAKDLGIFGVLGASATYAKNVAAAQAAEAAKKEKERKEKEAEDAKKAHDKAMNDFADNLEAEKKNAYNDLIGVRDPDKKAWLDFYDKMTKDIQDIIDKGGEEAASIKLRVAETWEYISAKQKEQVATQRIVDINKEVAQGLRELGDMLMINYRGLQITREEWGRMTKEEQKAVKRFVELSKAKDFVEDAMNGLEQVFFRSLNNIRENGFGNFFRDIIGMFDDMLFELATKWLASFFVNQILSTLGGIFGAANAVAGAVGGGGDIGMPGDTYMGNNMYMPGNAMGGPAVFGRAMIVGERGPEIFIPKQGGRIATMAQAAGGAGGGGTNVYITVNANDASSFKRSEGQIGAKVAAAINRASRRNG